MSDIILAEHQGTAWLVHGLDHLDALLDNSLPPEVTVAFIACQTAEEVNVLWRRYAGEAAEDQPWAIHPNIARRARGLGAGFSVQFTAWSALLDDVARDTVARAVSAAAASPEGPLRLIGQLDPAGGPMGAAMLQMRQQMLEDALASAGVDRSRLRRESRGPKDEGFRAELAEAVELKLGQ